MRFVPALRHACATALPRVLRHSFPLITCLSDFARELKLYFNIFADTTVTAADFQLVVCLGHDFELPLGFPVPLTVQLEIIVSEAVADVFLLQSQCLIEDAVPKTIAWLLKARKLKVVSFCSQF